VTLRLVCATILTAVAALSAGCGGGGGQPSVSAYEVAVVSARDRTDYALARITRAQSKDEFLNRMDEAEALIDKAADELADTGAPDAYAADNDKLVKRLHALANDVGLTADQIRLPGFGNFLAGARGLSFENWDKVTLVLARLIGEGIHVQLLGRH
jgi:hypothetical protein